MFPILLKKTRQEIDSLRKSIQTNASLRDLLAQAGSDSPLSNIALHSPTIHESQRYDHCAVLIRLYATYEIFVEELISEYLFLLPTLYDYADLDDSFHTEHRNGIAHLLQKLDMDRYKTLAAEKVVKSYLEAISGMKAYEILPQTMLRYEQNLRLNILDMLFSRVSITGVHSWLNSHRIMKSFLVDIRGEQNTLDSELTSFIEYRNEVAHGRVEKILGPEELLAYCEFVDALCQALNERLNHCIISRQLEIGTAQEIGIVTERYRNRVFVAKIRNATITVGEKLFFLGNRYCYPTIMESIQIDGVSHTTVIVSDEQEIGFQVTVQGRKKARLIRPQRITAK